jgi:hypothetical protein
MALIIALALALAFAGCAAEESEVGSVALYLRSAGSDGASYMLRNAVFDLEGSADETVYTDNGDTNEEVRLVDVPSGMVQVTLRDGWRLERNERGSWVAVDAWLVSDNPLWVEVTPEGVAPAVFQFQLESGEYVAPEGTLGIDFEVLPADRSVCPPGETHRLVGPTPYDAQGPYCGYGGSVRAADGTYLEGQGSQFCECVPESQCWFYYRGGRFDDSVDVADSVACNQDGELYWDGVAPHRDSDWCVCLESPLAQQACPAGEAYRLKADAPFSANDTFCGYAGEIRNTDNERLMPWTSPYCECVPESECEFYYRGGRFADTVDVADSVACTSDGRLYWEGVAPHRDSDWCVCR